MMADIRIIQRLPMQRSNTLNTAAGSALIVPGLLFFIGVTLTYMFKVASFGQVFDDFVTRTLVPFNAGSVILNALIVLGPLAAAVITGVPFARQYVTFRQGDALMTIKITREGVWPLVVIIAGLCLTLIFGTYLLAENWQCITGAQTRC